MATEFRAPEYQTFKTLFVTIVIAKTLWQASMIPHVI